MQFSIYKKAPVSLLVPVVACCAVLGFLVCAGKATAAPTPEVRADYAAALAYWGTTSPPPQCASVRFEMLPTDPKGEEAIARTTTPKAGQRNLPCEMEIFDDLWAGLTRCERMIVIRHETGHLTGLGHSDDPSSIMYAELEGEEWCPEEPPAESNPRPIKQAKPEVIARHRMTASHTVKRWISSPISGVIHVHVWVGNHEAEQRLSSRSCGAVYEAKSVIVLIRLIRCKAPSRNPIEARYVSVGRPQNVRVVVTRER